MKNHLLSGLVTSLMVLTMSAPSSAAYAASADELVMNGIINTAGKVGVFNASKTVIVPLVLGKTDTAKLTAHPEADANTNLLNKYLNAAGSGTAVQIPEGDYYISNQIYLKSGTVLQGTVKNGVNVTRLFCTKSIYQLYGYSLDDNGSPAHNGVKGIVTFRSGSHVRNLNFTFSDRGFISRGSKWYNWGFNAFTMYKASDCSIRNVTITDFDIGIAAPVSTNCLIEDVTLNAMRNAHFGISLGSSQRIKVSRLKSVNYMTHDISLQSAHDNAFVDCILSNGASTSHYEEAISFRGGAGMNNNAFKNIYADDNPCKGNTSLGNGPLDTVPATFGNCYYSNVWTTNYIDVTNFTPSTAGFTPFLSVTSSLTNVIHFVGSSPVVPPFTVNAGADKSATLSSANTVTLQLSGSVTGASSSAWSKVSGPSANVVFSASNSSTTNATFTAAGTYILRLTATDGKGHTVSDDVQCIVSPFSVVNVPPVVSAGADKTAILGSINNAAVTVALAGSVSDADHDATSALWTKVSGPAAAVVFSSATAAATNATFTAVGTYVLRLTASDGKGHTVMDDVSVIVSPFVIGGNVAPVVNAGPDKSATLGSTNSVTVDLLATVKDADGDATTKLWTKTGGPTAAVSFSAATAENTKATFTVAGTYTLCLTADDLKGHIVKDFVQVVIAPKSSGGSGSPVVYEAEAPATVVSGAVKTSSFVDFINASNDYIEWAVNAPTAGSYTLTFKYSLSNGNRPLAIAVNGVIAASSLSFPGTNSEYKTVSLAVTLKQGSNKVRATAIGYSGANIDSLTVAPVIAPAGVAALPGLDHTLGSWFNAQ